MSGGYADYWDFFAKDALKTGSVLYSRLSAGIGGDEELKALAARARKGQPHANLILAAVHFLLLRGADDPLKRFYATVCGTVSAQHEAPFPDFAAFVRKHRAAIEPMIATRVTNTNEVGRSAVLNLIWDKYGVRYRRNDTTVASINDAAPLGIDCEARGDKVPPAGAPPPVASRLGLELNPVDLSN